MLELPFCIENWCDETPSSVSACPRIYFVDHFIFHFAARALQKPRKVGDVIDKVKEAVVKLAVAKL